jgi:hypothetical protein
MIVLNVIAALLLALTPALEPCRLHDFFCQQSASEAAEHQHADHMHCHDADSDPGGSDSQPCPEHPKHCNHLTDADGVPTVVSIVIAMPGLPAIDACFVSSLVSVAHSLRSSFQHPPPTGVALVGISNLRI